MAITLLLTAVLTLGMPVLIAVVTLGTPTNIKDTKNPFRVSMPPFSVSFLSETMNEEESGAGGKQKVVAQKSTDSGSPLEESFLKIISEKRPIRNVGQSKLLLPGGHEQIVTDDTSGIRAKRQVLKDFRNKTVIWTEGVSYTFNTTDQRTQEAFMMGVKVWTSNTCIDFKENSSAKDKVVVLKSDICSSEIGRVGGDQYIRLCTDYAAEGSAVHEIGHALGLLHTMARYDRDDYITLIKRNVDPALMDNFDKVGWQHVDVYNLTYDYGSVMHYGQLCASANNRPTMIAKDLRYQTTMGSAIISFSDIFVINKRYGCDAKCNKTTSANCSNEGFPHPRNCSICICPSGYGGALCDRRPPGCGEDLVATESKKVFIGRIGFGYGFRDQFTFCHYLISAPEGKKIEVELQSISQGYYDHGCRAGGIEIKAQKDQKLTGFRFCSLNGTYGPIASNSNPLPVILFNRRGTMDAVFTYRFID